MSPPNLATDAPVLNVLEPLRINLFPMRWKETNEMIADDRERSGPETALSAAAVEFFGVASVEAVATLVYSKPLTKGEIAAFAIETARAAHAGDAVAGALYERAAALIGHPAY